MIKTSKHWELGRPLVNFDAQISGHGIATVLDIKPSRRLVLEHWPTNHGSDVGSEICSCTCQEDSAFSKNLQPLQIPEAATTQLFLRSIGITGRQRHSWRLLSHFGGFEVIWDTSVSFWNSFLACFECFREQFGGRLKRGTPSKVHCQGCIAVGEKFLHRVPILLGTSRQGPKGHFAHWGFKIYEMPGWNSNFSKIRTNRNERLAVYIQSTCSKLW